jgi:DNA-binding FadR family transcriptional regulator
MSDCDIRQFENILLEAMVGLQRGNMKTHAMREREFYETIAEQSGNSARSSRRWGSLGCKSSSVGQSQANGEFAERAANGYVDIIKAFKARDTPRAAFLVRAHISYAQEVILARFPNEIAFRWRYAS